MNGPPPARPSGARSKIPIADATGVGSLPISRIDIRMYTYEYGLAARAVPHGTDNHQMKFNFTALKILTILKNRVSTLTKTRAKKYEWPSHGFRSSCGGGSRPIFPGNGTPSRSSFASQTRAPRSAAAVVRETK